MDPRFVEVIREAAKAEVASVHVSAAAEVLEYDADSETARIVLEVMRREVDENGENQFDEVVIPEVTVVWPRFGPYRIVGPLNKGDQVTAVFFDRSHDEWQSGRGPGIEPSDFRRHDYADAWCLPGGLPPGDAEGTTDFMTLGGENIVVEIDDDADEIRLGGSAAGDFVALASLVKSELDALWQALMTHTHMGVTPGFSSTLPTTTVGNAGDVGADRVKAD